MNRTFLVASVATLLLAAAADSAAITGTGVSGEVLDCTAAEPTLQVLWPPDHQMVPINVRVPGSDGSVMITKIEQNEPLNALGDGNFEPDGRIDDPYTAWVRAERSGTGSGRVYYISFTATGTDGATCSGTVKTYVVPHDQRPDALTLDESTRYDSTGA
jgi:hypothetical protein